VKELPHQYEVVRSWICSEKLLCLLKENELFIKIKINKKKIKKI